MGYLRPLATLWWRSLHLQQTIEFPSYLASTSKTLAGVVDMISEILLQSDSKDSSKMET
jgi:hypothetical protein